jgi:hypothetical protein
MVRLPRKSLERKRVENSRERRKHTRRTEGMYRIPRNAKNSTSHFSPIREAYQCRISVTDWNQSLVSSVLQRTGTGHREVLERSKSKVHVRHKNLAGQSSSGPPTEQRTDIPVPQKEHSKQQGRRLTSEMPEAHGRKGTYRTVM